MSDYDRLQSLFAAGDPAETMLDTLAAGDSHRPLYRLAADELAELRRRDDLHCPLCAASFAALMN